MIYQIIEGTTSAITFQLLDTGLPVDLTGVAIALLVEDSHGTTISPLGSVVISNATNGKVQFTPTNSSVLVASTGPYFARWQLTDGTGKVFFLPSTTRDLWDIVGK